MNVKLEKVAKKFREIPAVQNLSFIVKRGEIMGLLGPNGAGKTTTLRMILDILRPDEGNISFDGQKINRKIRNCIGYLPEERGIYQKHRIGDVLEYFGRLKNLAARKSQVETVRLLDRFQMVDLLEEPVSHLSKGQQQKLQFLITLLHNPQIVIMDEPFWGLDPVNQEIVKEKIISLKKEGKTILISTHQLNEAEELCDYFVMLEFGQVILRGTLNEIRRKLSDNIIVVEANQDLATLREIKNVRKIDERKTVAKLYVNKSANLSDILRQIINTVDITRLEIKKPSLHEIFSQTINGRSSGKG